MGKVRMLVMLVVMVLLSGFVVSAQGDISGGEIVIQPEGLLYTVMGALVGGLLTFAGLYTSLKGRNPSADLKPEDRSGMLGILLVGGWLASKSPGEWDDKQIERLMSGYGFQSPVSNPLSVEPHPPTPPPKDREGEKGQAFGAVRESPPFKSVRRSPAPPDLIDPSFGMSPDLPLDSWVEDEEVKG